MKFRKSFTFFQKILSAVYTFLFCLFSIVAANRCFPTCYKEFVAIYVVVSPGFIPPNLCDVYPHYTYTDFVRPIFFFFEKTALPNIIFFTGFVYTSTIGNLPFPLRDKYPQVTCLSNIPFVGTRFIYCLHDWTAMHVLILIWNRYQHLFAVDAWKGWPRQGCCCCCYKRYCARSRCEKRLFASSCLSVLLEQLGSHWTDFREIWYLSIFRKSI